MYHNVNEDVLVLCYYYTRLRDINKMYSANRITVHSGSFGNFLRFCTRFFVINVFTHVFSSLVLMNYLYGMYIFQAIGNFPTLSVM